jgi:hypothetical protein
MFDVWSYPWNLLIYYVALLCLASIVTGRGRRRYFRQ